MGLKIATWSVNRIRAREAQLCDWGSATGRRTTAISVIFDG